jgi:hypothetical protein
VLATPRYLFIINSVFWQPDKHSMFDNIENLILEHLHHIRSRVELIADDMSDLKLHISSLESAMVSVNMWLHTATKLTHANK